MAARTGACRFHAYSKTKTMIVAPATTTSAGEAAGTATGAGMPVSKATTRITPTSAKISLAKLAAATKTRAVRLGGVVTILDIIAIAMTATATTTTIAGGVPRRLLAWTTAAATAGVLRTIRVGAGMTRSASVASGSARLPGARHRRSLHGDHREVFLRDYSREGLSSDDVSAIHECFHCGADLLAEHAKRMAELQACGMWDENAGL